MPLRLINPDDPVTRQIAGCTVVFKGMTWGQRQAVRDKIAGIGYIADKATDVDYNALFPVIAPYVISIDNVIVGASDFEKIEDEALVWGILAYFISRRLTEDQSKNSNCSLPSGISLEPGSQVNEPSTNAEKIVELAPVGVSGSRLHSR